MRTLTLLHSWAGGILGLVLMLLGLTGSVLAVEQLWIDVPHASDPPREQIASFARAAEAASQAREGLLRVTFADENLGVHHASYADGAGAYLSWAGEVVERWSTMWERPELWLFDLHHYLLLGEFGKNLTGVIGLIGLFFVVSGAILWWRTRRTFRMRIWPARMTRSAIVRHHRDMGIVAAPFLIVAMATGVLIVFGSLSHLLLSPFGTGAERTSPPTVATSNLPLRLDWKPVFAAARERYPDASFRRLQLPRDAESPIVLRMKQPDEWTPNGRTYAYFDHQGVLISVDDPSRYGVAQAIEEKFYPIHAGKVGGGLWMSIVFLTGLVLAGLGGLTTYSFWFRSHRAPPAPTPLI